MINISIAKILLDLIDLIILKKIKHYTASYHVIFSTNLSFLQSMLFCYIITHIFTIIRKERFKKVKIKVSLCLTKHHDLKTYLLLN